MNVSEANAAVIVLKACGFIVDRDREDDPDADDVAKAVRFLAERAGKALMMTFRVVDHGPASTPPPEIDIPSNDARQRASHDEGRCPRCLVSAGHPIIGTLARLRRRTVTHHEAQLFVTANCTCVCHAVSPKDDEQ